MGLLTRLTRNGTDPLQLQRVGLVVGAHRGGVAGGGAVPQPGAGRQCRQHLGEPGLVVVDLVAVRVQHQAVPFGQADGYLQGADAVLPGVLEVRDRAHHVRAVLGGAGHQFLAAGKRADALLRERHELQADDVPDLIPDLGQRVQCGQLRVGHVDVAAHVQYAVGRLPAQHLGGPADHVLAGERGLALSPAGDPLPQGAAEVPARLPRGEGGVEVDVRLDVGRRGERAAGVDDGAGRRQGCGVGRGGTDLGEPALVDQQVGEAAPVSQPGVADYQIDHQAPCLDAGRRAPGHAG